MSMKKFSPPLLGKMKTAGQIEAERSLLWADYQEFLKIEASDELKEFRQLEQYVNSAEFKSVKNEINVLKFDGSLEFNQLKEFQKIGKSKNIRTFFAVSESPDLKKFKGIRSSEKLKEFYALEEFVGEGQFEKEKKEILSQVFKGSVEERHLVDFQKLQKDKGIRAWLELHNSAALKQHTVFSKSEKLKRHSELKNQPDKDPSKRKEFRNLGKDQEIRAYFRFEKSKKFRLYHETAKSHLLSKYEELKKFTESETFKERRKFLEDSTKYQKSETSLKYNRFKILMQDTDIRFFRKFEKSSPYKIFLVAVDSFELKRHRELEKITGSEAFLKRKAYLEDKKRWEKAPEYVKEQRYLSMKKLPHLIKYFGYLGSSAFDFLKAWEISFEDQFRSNQPDPSKWITNSYLSKKLLGKQFSQFGDLQCYTDGNNLKTGEKGLNIAIRKEKTAGIAWKADTGFIPVDFEYTSGILSTGESFWQKEGIFEAKVRFDPVKEVLCSIALIGENGQLRINIMEQGAKNWSGLMVNTTGKKPEFNGVSFNRLKKGASFIFRVHWEKNRIHWLVNDREMVSLPAEQINLPVHLNIAAFVVHDIPESRFPVNFNIEWVRCYRRK